MTYGNIRHIRRPIKRTVAVQRANGIWCRTDLERAERAKSICWSSSWCFYSHNEVFRTKREATIRAIEQPNPSQTNIEPVTVEEVAHEIKSLQAKKSPGNVGIEALAIKLLPLPAIQLLAKAFNNCFQLGHFPTPWKRAEVILIPKPGKPEGNLASYRLISLLAKYLKEAGFRRSHSTPEQCQRLVSTILNAFEEKKYCCAVFLSVK